MHQKGHESREKQAPSVDADHAPLYNNSSQRDHPWHSRCSESGDESHDDPGAVPGPDSGPNLEEWVTAVEPRVGKGSTEQTMTEDHEQPAQRERQATQHH